MKHLARIVTVLAAIAFITMVAFMQFDPADYAALDAFATHAAHTYQTLPWVEFFIVITTIGSTTGIITIGLLVAFLLRKDRVLVARLLLLMVGESTSVQLVKSQIHRVRPDALPYIGTLHSFSFPSGHATAAMALFGFIMLVCMYMLPRMWERVLAVVLPVFLIGAIGLSRIVLAAHFFSDVIAGYVLGVFWLGLVFLLPLEKLKWLRGPAIVPAGALH
jgi:undecaprenyl-diphosphatase